jgi:thiamine-phosphate pyrophosphorylase
VNESVPDPSPDSAARAGPRSRLPGPLLLVTDRLGAARPLTETVAAFLGAGGSWVWFRDRDLPRDERRRLAERVAERVFAEGGTLTIGSDLDLAAELGADGLHLGGGHGDRIGAARNRLGARALIGLSAHGSAETAEAAAQGADYATLSPIFPSASKPGYGPALGPDAIRTAPGLPIVALGGVTADTVGACRAAGAAACAVMGTVMSAPDPGTATRSLLEAWNRAQ